MNLKQCTYYVYTNKTWKLANDLALKFVKFKRASAMQHTMQNSMHIA